MNRISRAHIIMAGLVLLALIAANGMKTNAGEPGKKIRVIYTGDTMGYLEPCG